MRLRAVGIPSVHGGEDVKTNILQVKFNDVVKVYSGKPGCGCGCRGNYRINPSHLELANKARGYDHEASDVNLTQVKKILFALKEAETFNPGSVTVDDDGKMTIYALENSERFRWVFVKKN